ncbi:hypothetical protein [Kitasatospora sp. HPMI-4]|uniref:hypothetical protein n=1 Tax=Kitasatospora sp. HPMI-4 TaxID=3448443 RepID=UPI003F193F37
MTKIRTKLASIGMTVGLAAGAGLLAATPASANSSYCITSSPSNYCQTGTVAAYSNNTVQVYVNGLSGGGGQWQVYDSNTGVRVGWGYFHSGSGNPVITISGLYGSAYYLVIGSDSASGQIYGN